MAVRYHTGHQPGYSDWFGVLPEAKLVIVLLTNRGGLDVAGVAEALLDPLLQACPSEA